MTLDLVPTRLFRFPSYPSLWEEDEDWSLTQTSSTGLSISEDEKNIYVEAAVPGIDPKNIEVTFDKGVLWVKGEAKTEEKKEKKYYRKAVNSFSYRVAVPGDIDQDKEPDATCKNGVMMVTFVKKPRSQPKKIMVKG